MPSRRFDGLAAGGGVVPFLGLVERVQDASQRRAGARDVSALRVRNPGEGAACERRQAALRETDGDAPGAQLAGSDRLNVCNDCHGAAMMAARRRRAQTQSHPPNLPPPGPDLWERIDRIHRHDRRPVLWAADGLPVPVLDWTAEWAFYDLHEPQQAGILPAVAAHLDGGRDGPSRVERSARSRVQLRRLTLAAYRDIGNEQRAAIASQFGWPDDLGGLNAVRRDAAAGRALWTRLGAWPWWAIAAAWADGDALPPDLAGGLPGAWWRLPRVIATFDAWASGSQRPLREHDRAEQERRRAAPSR
jgi:hypothetical protein